MNQKLLIFIISVIAVIGILSFSSAMSVGHALTPANNSVQSTLFSDDFSGDLTQWEIIYGDWYIDEQQLVGHIDPIWSYNGHIYAGDTFWTDYSFEVKMVSPGGWIQFRSTGNGLNEYVFKLQKYNWAAPNSFYISKYQNGVLYDITDGYVISPVPITSPCMIKVMAIGSQLYFFINGDLVFQYDDPNPLLNGRIGLSVPLPGTVRFDDVLVQTIPPVVMLPPDQQGFSMSGDIVTYTTELQNHSGVASMFNLEVLPGSTWTTTLSSQQVGPIQDGEWVTFTTSVQIPASAAAGESDSAQIKATSNASPIDTGNTSLNTSVLSGEVAYKSMEPTNRIALVDTTLDTVIGVKDLTEYGCLSPEQLKLNFDGTELYVMCNASQNIVVLDTSDLSLVAAIDRAGTCHQDLTFVRFGAYALATDERCLNDNRIDVIDTAAHTIVKSIPIPHFEVYSISSHPFLPLAYVAAFNDSIQGFIVVDTNTFTPVTYIHLDYVYQVVASPDGQWLYVSHFNGYGLEKIDARTYETVSTLPGYGRAGLAITADGTTIYSKEAWWDGQVSVIDTASMQLITSINVGASGFDISLSCDGSKLFVARDEPYIPIIDTQTNTVITTIPLSNGGSLYGIATCPQRLTQGAFLSPLSQSGHTKAGSTITYEMEMINLTGETDSFSLELLAGSSYTTTLSTNQVGPIDDHASATFTVSIEAPSQALPGEVDTASFRASLVSSPGEYSNTAQIQTNITSGKLAYVTQSTNDLGIIDISLRQVIDTINLESKGCFGPWRTRLSPSGSLLAILCESSSILLVYNIPELTLNFELSYPGGSGDDIVFRLNEDYAFISSRNGSAIQVLDILAQSIVTTIPLEEYGHVNSMVMSPDSQKIYAAGWWMDGGRVFVINPQSFVVDAIIDYGYELQDVVVSSDNLLLYASDSWSNLGVIDINTHTIVDEITGEGEQTGLALSKDGTTIFVGRGPTGYVNVYDSHSHALLESVLVGGNVKDLTMDCEGEYLYISSSTNMVSAINTETYQIDFSITTAGLSHSIATCPQYQADLITQLTVDNAISHPKAMVTYQLSMSNLISDTISGLIITDTLPLSLTYNEGSLNASSGSASFQDGVIAWTGVVTANTTVTVSFSTIVSAQAEVGSSILNQAVFSYEGRKEYRRAYIDVYKNTYKTFIPCLSKPCLPDYSDDFSNPGSGWAIIQGNGYWMGYQNDEYYIAENSGWIAWALRDFGSSDFRVAVDTRPLTNLDGGAGIMFGVSNYGFYMFEVSDGWYSLWRTDIYGNYWYWTPLIDWNISPAVKPGHQINRLQVDRIGSKITVYVNGQMLGSVSDGTHRGTVLGMVSEAYYSYFDGRFDNFILYTGTCLGVSSGGTQPPQASTHEISLYDLNGGQMLTINNKER